MVENEDIGVAKENPEVEAEDAVSVSKGKLGFIVAGAIKEGFLQKMMEYWMRNTPMTSRW